MNVHEHPRNDTERLELLSMMAVQARAVVDDKTTLQCAGCGRQMLLHNTFRCYFCGLYFCRLMFSSRGSPRPRRPGRGTNGIK